MTQQAASVREGLLATILSEESYRPVEPESIADTGLTVSLVESFILKRLSMVGQTSGRKLAEYICVPFRLLEPIYQNLRARQLIVHKSTAPLNDYNYTLTEVGSDRARIAMDACSYVGPAPVPLMDYLLATEAQSIRAESPKREDLIEAFEDITVDEELFESLGPAINSGAGLFLYGEPGNGKSTLAKRITSCFGQDVWLPHVIIEDGQLIKLYDAAFHQESTNDDSSILKSAAYDRRWIKVRRPTVIVGGELTMNDLEIRYDANSNVSEAPLQMKSNCGCLLIDDFGRQRIDPAELLNRWIVPLEARYDFLTLSTGKKIQVPFEQLIIFSTNLDPEDLVDEAFLRRIPYKIEIGNPDPDEFHELFEIYADNFGCEYRPDVIDVLIERHYEQAGRAMRRCHPRDLLTQIRNYCVYNDYPLEMHDQYFDRVVKSYFSVVIEKQQAQDANSSPTSRQTMAVPVRPQDPDKDPASDPKPPQQAQPSHTQQNTIQGVGNQPISKQAPAAQPKPATAAAKPPAPQSKAPPQSAAPPQSKAQSPAPPQKPAPQNPAPQKAEGANPKAAQPAAKPQPATPQANSQSAQRPPAKQPAEQKTPAQPAKQPQSQQPQPAKQRPQQPQPAQPAQPQSQQPETKQPAPAAQPLPEQNANTMQMNVAPEIPQNTSPQN